MKTCQSWHNRVAWYFGVSVHDTFGKRSRIRLIYSYSIFVAIAIVDVTVAVYVVYVRSIGSEFLEFFNQSLAAFLDIFTFSGLLVHLVEMTKGGAKLSRAFGRTYELNRALFWSTWASIFLTILALVSRICSIKNFAVLSVDNVNHVWNAIYSMMTLVYFMIASQFCHLVDASSYKIDKLKNIVKNAKGKRKIPSIFKCLYLLDRKAEEMQSVNEIFDKQLFYFSFNAFTACILNGYYGIVYTIIGNQGFLYGMGYFTGIMVKLLGVLLICTCCTTAQKYVSKILNVRNQIWNI
ncbi:Hypothetical protein NTJ_12927 [Nesidiocoris tenuis]|uniref:Gustatory receptor n=1 Tax=Nesidiocoris tenuis TaxID=355587 RepID=A0ABN7BA82_9HEMI|nr:Hypothetical protein NTJ_12927 [Nesidiocoris tenuis]